MDNMTPSKNWTWEQWKRFYAELIKKFFEAYENH